MQSFTRLFSLTLLAVSVSGAILGIVPPASQGTPDSATNVLDLSGTQTDDATIVSLVAVVDQKAGATTDAPPDQPVQDTVVTVLDGQLTNQTAPTRRDLKEYGGLVKRLNPGYTQVFPGTGTGPTDRDGSIQGTAYLTYTVVSNATYSVDDCLAFCDQVTQCVFANLYYEFNNALLDFVFSEKSNLKCALYADIHTAAEKTNLGGQQSIPPPADLTYIQQSTGWAAKTLADPTTPDGYELVFGPTGGANNAPGYMGFAFLDKYDVNACAALCNTRGPDGNGGACKYFNIWRALVNGVPTTYTCSMYFVATDASTAVNYGQGDLQVTYSRGYRRVSALLDGGFEGYTCSYFCYTESYAAWIGTSPAGGFLDASIFHYVPYAHSGGSVGLLGSATGNDALAGTLKPAETLNTVAGRNYVITYFHSSTFSGPTGEANAFVDVLWNDNVVSTIHPGYSPWTYYQVQVTAVGGDRLAFHGGKAPSWSFIDDVYVFLI